MQCRSLGHAALWLSITTSLALATGACNSQSGAGSGRGEDPCDRLYQQYALVHPSDCTTWSISINLLNQLLAADCYPENEALFQQALQHYQTQYENACDGEPPPPPDDCDIAAYSNTHLQDDVFSYSFWIDVCQTTLVDVYFINSQGDIVTTSLENEQLVPEPDTDPSGWHYHEISRSGRLSQASERDITALCISLDEGEPCCNYGGEENCF